MKLNSQVSSIEVSGNLINAQAMMLLKVESIIQTVCPGTLASIQKPLPSAWAFEFFCFVCTRKTCDKSSGRAKKRFSGDIRSANMWHSDSNWIVQTGTSRRRWNQGNRSLCLRSSKLFGAVTKYCIMYDTMYISLIIYMIQFHVYPWPSKLDAILSVNRRRPDKMWHWDARMMSWGR